MFRSIPTHVRRFSSANSGSTTVTQLAKDVDSSIAKRLMSWPVQARNIFGVRISGWLSTISPNFANPYVSIMPYAESNRRPGEPIVAFNKGEQHEINVLEYAQTTLIIYPLTPQNVPPTTCGVPYVQLRAVAEPCTTPDDKAWAEELWYKRFPQSRAVMNEPSFFRLRPDRVTLAGPTLREPILMSADEYESAQPDVVALASRFLIEELNSKHTDGLLRLCRRYADPEDMLESAFCWNIDSLGFDLMAQKELVDSGTSTEPTEKQYMAFRLPFDTPLESMKQCRDMIEFLVNNPDDDGF